MDQFECPRALVSLNLIPIKVKLSILPEVLEVGKTKAVDKCWIQIGSTVCKWSIQNAPNIESPKYQLVMGIYPFLFPSLS